MRIKMLKLKKEGHVLFNDKQNTFYLWSYFVEHIYGNVPMSESD